MEANKTAEQLTKGKEAREQDSGTSPLTVVPPWIRWEVVTAAASQVGAALHISINSLVSMEATSGQGLRRLVACRFPGNSIAC